MSTLNVENIKYIAADSDSFRLATDGTVTFTKNVTAVTVDSATITNLNTTSGNINADSATITNLSGTNMTASGDIKGSSFNGGQLGGRRNIIINGAMQVAQRAASGPGGVTSSGWARGIRGGGVSLCRRPGGCHFEYLFRGRTRSNHRHFRANRGREVFHHQFDPALL